MQKMARLEKEYYVLEAEKAGEVSKGGAETLYLVKDTSGKFITALKFQDRPVPEGVVGLTNEFLIEVIIDRLKAFQSGPFPDPYNAGALTNLEKALECLTVRHEERISRGVQGKYEK